MEITNWFGLDWVVYTSYFAGQMCVSMVRIKRWGEVRLLMNDMTLQYTLYDGEDRLVMRVS